MKMIARILVMSLLVLGLSATAYAEGGEDDNLTLVEAVRKGILKNPEYGVVANNNLAVKEELNQANALYRPSVDFAGESGYEHTDTPAIREEGLWRNRASLTLTQLLFDGFGRESEVERQQARVITSANRVGEVAEFVGLDVVQAYMEVLRQRDLLAIASVNVEDHLKILATIQAGASAGTVTEGDVAQAQARVAQARATVASTEQDLRSAEASFIQSVGETPGDMMFPEIPRDKLLPTVGDSVRRALTNSPTLSVFESDINVAYAEYKAQGSELFPRIELQANAVQGDDVNGLNGNFNTQSVLAVASWNLYRGGADRARQSEFLHRHAQSKERRAQAARQVERDIRDTWAGMMAAGERAKQFLDQATANEKVVDVYLDQFSLDRRTLLDVLDSQNELFVSRSSHISALYTEMFAVFRVLALQGDMLSTLGVAKPSEAAVPEYEENMLSRANTWFD